MSGLEGDQDIEDLKNARESDKLFIKQLETENSRLKMDISRLNENIQKLSYKELMESKLNTTNDYRMNNDIRQLEEKLKRVEKDKKTLTMELSRVQESFDCSMMKAFGDPSEKKLKLAEEKNLKLSSELRDAKKRILQLEKDRDAIDPIQNLNNLTQLFGDDVSFLQGGGNIGEITTFNIPNENGSTNIKIELLNAEVDSLKRDLAAKEILIEKLRKENHDKEKSTSNSTGESKLIEKLRDEIKELRALTDSLFEKNKKSTEEKSALRIKLDQLEDKTYLNSGKNYDNLEFKVKTLEQTNINLLKEIRMLKRAAKGMSVTPDSKQEIDINLKLSILEKVVLNSLPLGE